MNQFLKATLCSCAFDNVGLYPEAIINAQNVSCERTEYQNGWNDCLDEILKKTDMLHDWVEKQNISEVRQLKIARLLFLEKIYIYAFREDLDICLFINWSDKMIILTLEDIDTLYVFYKSGEKDWLTSWMKKYHPEVF